MFSLSALEGGRALSPGLITPSAFDDEWKEQINYLVPRDGDPGRGSSLALVCSFSFRKEPPMALTVQKGKKLSARASAKPTTDRVEWIMLWDEDPNCEPFGFGFTKEDDQLVILTNGELKPASPVEALKWWEAIESSPLDPGGNSGSMYATGKFLRRLLFAIGEKIEIDVTPEMRIAAGREAGGDVGAWCQDRINHAVETDLREVAR